MILSKTFEQFVEDSPVCVMIRGSLEYALPESVVNQIFETTALKQYTHNLLFSDVVDVMGSVSGSGWERSSGLSLRDAFLCRAVGKSPLDR